MIFKWQLQKLKKKVCFLLVAWISVCAHSHNSATMPPAYAPRHLRYAHRFTSNTPSGGAQWMVVGSHPRGAPEDRMPRQLLGTRECIPNNRCNQCTGDFWSHAAPFRATNRRVSMMNWHSQKQLSMFFYMHEVPLYLVIVHHPIRALWPPNLKTCLKTTCRHNRWKVTCSPMLMS